MGKIKFVAIVAMILAALALFEAAVLGQTSESSAKTAQAPSLSGSVRDAEGLPLPGVTIWLKGTTIKTETDEYGAYLLANVPPGQWAIVASLPSFQTSETSVAVAAGQSIRQDLTLEVGELSYEMTVHDDAPKLLEASESIGVVSVSPRQLATLPSLGEKDLFRSLQFMPGVSASNESSSGLYVRGGTPDQNLVRFDGFTVYNVDHFYGIFSAFNAQAVDNITMYKGGFESKYGGRISSVVELDGRRGNTEEVAFGGGVSLLSYNGYTEIPFGRKASLVLAGRNSFPSPLSHRIRDSYATTDQGGPGGGAGPGGSGLVTQPESTFYDLNGRFTYDIGKRDRFTFSVYNGEDNLDSSRDMSLPGGFGEQTNPITGEITNISRWGNTGLSANYWRQWADSLTSSFTVAHSRYFRDRDRRSTMTMTDPDTEEETTSERGQAESNRLTDVSLLVDNSLTLGYKHIVEFGFQGTRNQVRYSFEMAEAESSMTRNQIGSQYSLYLQDRWSPTVRFAVTPGFRATYYDRSDRMYWEPRLSFTYHASDRLRFKGAGGLYYQYANNLVREDVLEGDQDFWTLGDKNKVPVSSGRHAILGLSFETDNYLFDVEAYRKDLKGLAEFGSQRLNRPGGWGPPPGGAPPPPPEGDEIRGPIDFTELFFTGKGRAEGVEFLLQKKYGAHVGWLTYSLGRVRHYFPSLSDGWYPASHDSTHEVKIVDTWRYRRWLVSGTWIFATGKPVTAPTGVEEITLPNDLTISVPVFGGKNASRLPDYHRLDASVSRDLYVGERSKATAGVSVFNAYNRSNVWRREYMAFEGELIPTDVSYLGWTVSAFLNVDVSVPSELRRAGPAWKDKSSSGAQPASQPDAAGGDAEKQKAKRVVVRTFDFKGTLDSMTPTVLTVSSKWGAHSFKIDDATITGQERYEPGTPLHVYYQRRGDEDVATMVVRRID